ncbi:ATP-binding protein [Streptomyces sp. NBC_00638]|uniref:AAA family ATPase n=1 Tax=unclassified Streptomyces TaxID=2593676 RepID=UPI0022597E9C|nr:AAA family ATPase [Streptomyces sp. NBC_00638]MCX5001187.1 ATP-binding protein [Streptomyces sp. NBC_00638]
MTLQQGGLEAVALPRPYRDDHEHLADELHRLDLLIRLRIATMDLRNAMVPGDQTTRAVYISDEEVNWLLATGADDELRITRNGDTALEDLHDALRRAAAEIETRSELSAAEGTVLRLPALGRLFGLTPPELGAVVIALAPELRRKYDRLYAYLQDDITRKRPSVDLMLELLYTAERQRWAARSLFDRTAPLLRYDILRAVDDPQSPSGSTGLAQFMALDARICQFLLGFDDVDAKLMGCARLDRPPRRGEAQDEDEGLLCPDPLRLAEHHLAAEAGPEPCALVFRLIGPDGAGKREVARSTSHRLGMPLLDVDLRWLTGRSREETDSLVRAAFREAVLQAAAVRLASSDLLEGADAASLRLALTAAITDFGGLLFLTAESDPAGLTCLDGHLSLPVPVPLPDVTQSAARWRRALRGHTDDPKAWSEELGCRFRVSTGRMQAALEHAENRLRMESETRPLRLSDVSAACREQSRRRLGDLAVRVHPYARWEDLVLPEDRVAHLKEICCQAKHRHRVHDNWGFGARLSHGKGLGVLFSGPPGTGKTMAAEVLAHELDTDLYKVDLSGVVSKYVGETEKNLARIFSEAQTADAILFFDEADALYGRRTEVSDAHDRYANIETSYLLQRVEEHEGIVVLATNLRSNMDDAFTRRLRYIVEFPFPEAESRQRIWQALFPPQAPLDPDIDFAELAKEFPVAGGNIKNIVLNAACLASADGGAISRHHVLRAARCEFGKIGKLWTGPGTPAGTAVDHQGGDQC